MSYSIQGTRDPFINVLGDMMQDQQTQTLLCSGQSEYEYTLASTSGVSLISFQSLEGTRVTLLNIVLLF